MIIKLTNYKPRDKWTCDLIKLNSWLQKRNQQSGACRVGRILNPIRPMSEFHRLKITYKSRHTFLAILSLIVSLSFPSLISRCSSSTISCIYLLRSFLRKLTLYFHSYEKLSPIRTKWEKSFLLFYYRPITFRPLFWMVDQFQ